MSWEQCVPGNIIEDELFSEVEPDVVPFAEIFTFAETAWVVKMNLLEC